MSFSVVLFHNPHSATTTLSTTIFTISSSSSSSSSSFRPRRSHSSTNRIFPINQPTKPIPKKLQIETLAARDTVIDFGKHKGKMLGSLPSSYLKWVSKNLRAGDSEHWAKLADQVLDDDVYKDRTEWEHAEKILHGTDESMRASSSVKANSVSMLLEISERFGWDNEDKVGWSKIKFELLGTSKGGRIPRISKTKEEKGEIAIRRSREVKKEEDGDGLERRRERRERRMKEGKREEKGVLGKLEEIEKQLDERPKIQSPFPGRESLLKKVMNKKKMSL